jgi:PAS domain S-box-containing protein
MKLKLMLGIASIAAIFVLLVYGNTLRMDFHMMQLVQETNKTNELINKIAILRTLTADNIIYPGVRAQEQWLAVYEGLQQLLARPNYQALLREHGLEKTAVQLKALGDSFRKSLLRETAGPNLPESEVRKEFNNQLSAQLQLAAENMVTRFVILGQEVNENLLRSQQWATFFDIAGLLVLAALLIGGNLIFRRSVAAPILKLHEGAGIVGRGKLDYRIGLASRDEVGDLARAFDEMTASLQDLTVSRNELLREMEERQRAEEALRRSEASLAEAQRIARLGNWEWDIASNELTWSDETYRIFGLAPQEFRPTYEGFLSFIHPDDLMAVNHQVEEGLKFGKYAPYDYRIVRRDGSIRSVQALGETRFNQTGQPLMMLGTVQDITELKQAEEHLKRTLLDLERSNRDLEDFAYISSHDLQEPLRKIANFSDMLAQQYRDQLDEQSVRYFGYVTEGARRMQALINDLLSYSRVGRAELRLIPAPLEEILQGTLNDLHALIKENRAEISHDPLPTLKVNPHQMGQLLQNLIANAIKFHNDRPPRIHLSARQEGREWQVCVRDNGIGFEPQYAEGIFTVFKRLHGQGEYPGTGIGLAICKKIVERHGGRIWAKSEPGRGATFCFTIPS